MKRFVFAVLVSACVCGLSGQVVPRLDGSWKLIPERSEPYNRAQERPTEDIVLTIHQTDREIVLQRGTASVPGRSMRIQLSDTPVSQSLFRPTTATAVWQEGRLVVTGEQKIGNGEMALYRLVFTVSDDGDGLVMVERTSSRDGELSRKEVFTRLR